MLWKHLWWLPALFLSGCGGCGGGNGGGDDEPVIKAPTIELDAPSAGAFTKNTTVSLSGRVVKGSSPIAALEYNGTPLELDSSDRFSTIATVVDGINLVDLVATAHDGAVGVEGIAFHGGEVHPPGTTLESAAMLFLGADVLDDDTSDPDDLAALAALVLAGNTVADSMVGKTMQSDSFTLTPTDIEYGDVDVDIYASGNSIWVGVTLSDFWMDFLLVGDTWYWWAEHEGSMWADEIVLWTELEAGTTPSGVWVTADNTDVDLTDYGLTVEYVPDSLEGYLAEWTEDTVEENVAASIEETASDLLDQYLSVFELSFEPIEGVTLEMTLADIEVTQNGLNLTLDLTTSSSATGLVTGAGSLASDGDAPSWPPRNISAMAFAIDDDVLNQAIFAAWAVRLVDGITLDSDTVSAFPIPAPLGPFASIEASVGLPPVLTDPVDGDSLLGIGIGEIDLIMQRDDGEINHVNVGVTAGVSIELEDGALSFRFDMGSDTTEMAVGVREMAQGEAAEDIATAVSVMLPVAMSLSGAYLPSFDLPVFDLGAMGFDALAGVELSFADLSWERTDTRWLTATGTLE